jgi:LysM repeat protein
MTRKQIAFIVASIVLVNAVISAVISVVVVLLMTETTEVVSGGPTPTSIATTTQTVSEAVPTEEVITHVVRSGDTISGLAFEYDVPEQDIIAANQLENPNFLQVGMELIIPVGGFSQATATFTPAPTPTDTPIPFQPPSAELTATAAAALGATATPLPTPLPSGGELEIEISEVLGQGQIEQERVVLASVGDRLADMQGWTLSDDDGNIYTFPNFRLWAGGSVTVHTRIGTDGSPPANLYWGKLEPVWTAGEVVRLKDSEGVEISSAIVGP